MIRYALMALFLLPLHATAENELTIAGFLVGDYRLIGKAPDSDAAYTGKVRIYLENDALKVHRVINGKETPGDAAIETAVHGEARVLRIRFTENETAYEETCLWRSDLDNYGRISCYLYQPGKHTADPGLEALFYDRGMQ